MPTQMRSRWLRFAGLAGCVLVVGALLLAAAPGAFGQDAAPATTPAAPSANAPAHAEDGGLIWFLALIGPIGWLIFVLSFGLIALIVWLLLDLRGSVAMPMEFIEAFEDAINKRRFKEAFELAKAEQSMVGRVMTAGMTRLQHGLQEARDAALSMVDSLKARKDHITAYMATIGTLGPLFGLVGTVSGMIKSFSVLGKGGTPNPADLADGISEALYLTLLGISLSLPAIFFYSFFRNRMARIAIDITLMADDLLTQMFYSSKRPAGDPGAPVSMTGAKTVPPGPRSGDT